MNYPAWLLLKFGLLTSIIVLQALDNRSLRDAHKENSASDQGRKERRTRRTEAVAILTLLVVAAYTVVTYEQWRVAHETMIATSRAWMNIDYDPSTVSFDWEVPNGPTISMKVLGENKGNSPALNVGMFPVLIVDTFNQPNLLDQAKIVRSACDQLSGGPLGNLVFPADSNRPTNQASASFTRAAADAYREQAAKVNHLSLEKVRWVSFRLIICASYKVIGDDQDHITARVYNVGKIVDSPSGPRFVTLFMDDNLTPGKVALQSEFFGDYAN